MSRKNLTEKLKGELTDAMREALQDALQSLDQDQAIEDYLQEYLNDSNCFLIFDQEDADILIGIGPGDACRSFPIEICVEGTGGIAAAKAFIVKLEDACREEEERIARK